MMIVIKTLRLLGRCFVKRIKNGTIKNNWLISEQLMPSQKRRKGEKNRSQLFEPSNNKLKFRGIIDFALWLTTKSGFAVMGKKERQSASIKHQSMVLLLAVPAKINKYRSSERANEWVSDWERAMNVRQGENPVFYLLKLLTHISCSSRYSSLFCSPTLVDSAIIR